VNRANRGKRADLQRTGLYAEEKHRIAQAAAALVSDGDTVILMGGSTTLEVASHLVHKQNLTVITDSLLIAGSVAKHSEVDLIVLGGTLRHSEQSLGGHLAELCLKELRANKLIMGARAVNLQQGMMLETVAEVESFRASMRSANEIILVVDHSKFDQVGTAALAPITSVDRIVTDTGVSPDISGQLHDLGIKVVLA
jgi:DeoR/GlpR family transcriptional regulator of sugar metabolism